MEGASRRFPLELNSNFLNTPHRLFTLESFNPVVGTIFDFLASSLSSVKTVRLTCKKWKKIVDDMFLIERAILQFWNTPEFPNKTHQQVQKFIKRRFLTGTPILLKNESPFLSASSNINQIFFESDVDVLTIDRQGLIKRWNVVEGKSHTLCKIVSGAISHLSAGEDWIAFLRNSKPVYLNKKEDNREVFFDNSYSQMTCDDDYVIGIKENNCLVSDHHGTLLREIPIKWIVENSIVTDLICGNHHLLLAVKDRHDLSKIIKVFCFNLLKGKQLKFDKPCKNFLIIHDNIKFLKNRADFYIWSRNSIIKASIEKKRIRITSIFSYTVDDSEVQWKLKRLLALHDISRFFDAERGLGFTSRFFLRFTKAGEIFVTDLFKNVESCIHSLQYGSQ